MSKDRIVNTEIGIHNEPLPQLRRGYEVDVDLQWKHLTFRDQEIVHASCYGLTNGEIADALNLEKVEVDNAIAEIGYDLSLETPGKRAIMHKLQEFGVLKISLTSNEIQRPNILTTKEKSIILEKFKNTNVQTILENLAKQDIKLHRATLYTALDRIDKKLAFLGYAVENDMDRIYALLALGVDLEILGLIQHTTLTNTEVDPRTIVVKLNHGAWFEEFKPPVEINTPDEESEEIVNYNSVMSDGDRPLLEINAEFTQGEFSNQEKTALTLLASGYTQKEIADRLQTPPSCVHEMLDKIGKKTDCGIKKGKVNPRLIIKDLVDKNYVTFQLTNLHYVKTLFYLRPRIITILTKSLEGYHNNEIADMIKVGHSTVAQIVGKFRNQFYKECGVRLPETIVGTAVYLESIGLMDTGIFNKSRPRRKF